MGPCATVLALSVREKPELARLLSDCVMPLARLDKAKKALIIRSPHWTTAKPRPKS